MLKSYSSRSEGNIFPLRKWPLLELRPIIIIFRSLWRRLLAHNFFLLIAIFSVEWQCRLVCSEIAEHRSWVLESTRRLFSRIQQPSSLVRIIKGRWFLTACISHVLIQTPALLTSDQRLQIVPIYTKMTSPWASRIRAGKIFLAIVLTVHVGTVYLKPLLIPGKNSTKSDNGPHNQQTCDWWNTSITPCYQLQYWLWMHSRPFIHSFISHSIDLIQMWN